MTYSFDKYIIPEFIDVWQQFAESFCFVTVDIKNNEKIVSFLMRY